MTSDNYEYICVITSAIGTTVTLIPAVERYQQTLKTIESIRKKIPNCFIVVSDVSVQEIPQDWKELIADRVEYFLDFSASDVLIELSSKNLRSHSELLMMKETLQYIRHTVDLTNIKRIFKISGRNTLCEEFDIAEYDIPEVKDKFVFKKPVPSWIPGKKDWFLYETRLWSMDTSRLDFYIDNIDNCVMYCDGTKDIEHAHYHFIGPDNTKEFDMVWLEGVGATNGKYQKD